ncbi:hypothetical protein H7F15_16765 [Pontibacter sp. Tf4]|uniref:hypothetical protein n=1 Tax=Pontibacter sp. Tf4 TaxID=2761620 RepID=UPI0016257CF3|nr:hypothetical protein [Pontibacter sp. Tf4]MBB6612697.1 hypothetical protein [Pontibacter sp. Tf4]
MLTDKEQEEIRRKLLGLEEEPPADGWKKIAAEIRPPAPKRPLWWLWLTGLFLLLTGAGVYILQTKKSETQLAKQPETIAVQPAPIVGATVEENTGFADGKTQITVTQPATKIDNKTNKEIEQPEKPADKPAITEQTNTTETANVPKPNYRPAPVKVPVLVTAAPHKKPRTIAAQENQETIEPARTIDKDTNNTATVNISAELTASYLTMRETQLGDSVLSAPARVPFIFAHDPSVPKQTETDRDTLDEKQRKEWYISLAFAPRYSFKAVTPATSDDVYITSLRTNSKLDPERMGYEFGIQVGRQLKKQLYLEAGLSVMQLREDVSYSFTNGKVDTLLQVRLADGSYKATPVYATGERQLKSSFMYGGLRLGVTYFFWEQAQRRFNLTMAGGANLLVKGRTSTYSNGTLTETIDFPSEDNLLEQTNYNLMVGAGYNTTLHNKYELMLMPNLNYFLGSTYTKREPFGIKPYSLGLSIQLRRRFY